MNYAEAVRYLLSFADFERSGRFKDRPDVAPVQALLARLGGPHLGRRTVHIAGSKGKGSVAAMVASVLRSAGYRTGLYTSPHLHSYRERIQVNGEAISPGEFARLTGVLREAVRGTPLEERSLVTFDLLTALGFLAFREVEAGAQVIEVGLGGRVDSTNVFEEKDVACVTPIGLEHTQVLGDTVEEIAREKAAVIVRGCTAVMGPQTYEGAAAVIRERAADVGAPLVDVAATYTWRVTSHDLRSQELEIAGGSGGLKARLALAGRHQAENAATAIACIDALRGRGLGIPDEAVVAGLASVRWPARLEVLRESPLVLADGAHNRDSARRLREALVDSLGAGRVTLIVGAGADKDIGGLAAELAPVAGRVLAVRADHPRAMAPERIAEAFRGLGTGAEVVDNVASAIERSLAEAGMGGVICVTGSLFVAAEARERLGLGEKESI